MPLRRSTGCDDDVAALFSWDIFHFPRHIARYAFAHETQHIPKNVKRLSDKMCVKKDARPENRPGGSLLSS
jgi:hypothetical protein